MVMVEPSVEDPPGTRKLVQANEPAAITSSEHSDVDLPMTMMAGDCLVLGSKAQSKQTNYNLVTSILLVTPPENFRVKKFPLDNLIFMTSFFQICN